MKTWYTVLDISDTWITTWNSELAWKVYGTYDTSTEMKSVCNIIKVKKKVKLTEHRDNFTCLLDRGEWSASRPGRFTPKEGSPGTHWIGGWVGPRAALDAVVKRKIPSPRQESNPTTPIVQPVAQRYTNWAITALYLPHYTVKTCGQCQLPSMVLHRSNTRIVGSNPVRGTDVRGCIQNFRTESITK
jgi:hypothetical protein